MQGLIIVSACHAFQQVSPLQEAQQVVCASRQVDAQVRDTSVLAIDVAAAFRTRGPGTQALHDPTMQHAAACACVGDKTQ